jgi:aspartate racemase
MIRTEERIERLETDPLIGVIGGVGPYAGIDFMEKIFLNTKGAKDQDHIGCMMVSCPALIPDRSAFLLGESPDGKNPADGMFASTLSLYKAGVRAVAVACNTAHASRIFTPFHERTRALPGLTVVNMLETCAAFIKTRTAIRRLGLLATQGTYLSGVYHEYFREEDGFTLIEPEERGRLKIHSAIYDEATGIKTHPHPVKAYTKNSVLYEAFRLVERGADAVLLGCTELPLAIGQEDMSVPLFDPALFTARALIRLAAPEKLTPLSFPALSSSRA